MTEELKKFTYNEVGKHNKPTDCWIIIGDHVYDASNYVN
jgi:cytochrome b involved in lipid metabolism